MATLKQKKLARNIVENAKRDKPLNKQELVASVGYSIPSAEHKATEILESKGVKEELEELGFNEGNAKRVVGKILDSDSEESKDRLKAAEMIFKVHGSFAPEKSIQLNISLSEERKQELRDITTKVVETLVNEQINRTA